MAASDAVHMLGTTVFKHLVMATLTVSCGDTGTSDGNEKAARGSQVATHDAQASTPKPAKPSEPPKPEQPKPPWNTDTSASVSKLQGAWLVKGFGMYGAVSAWKFDGTKVTVYDPSKKTETPDVLIFESPCAVRLDSGYGGTLIIDGDDVYLGLGMGGFKQGDTIIACMHSGTTYSTPAGCTTWKNEFGRWSTVETTCSRPEGRFVATEKSNYGEGSIRFWNERILLTDQLHDNKLTKQASWDVAKAAADKLVAAKAK